MCAEHGCTRYPSCPGCVSARDAGAWLLYVDPLTVPAFRTNRRVLESVGGKVEPDLIEKAVNDLNGKDIDDLIEQ